MTVYCGLPEFFINFRHPIVKGMVGAWVTQGDGNIVNLIDGVRGTIVGANAETGDLNPDQYGHFQNGDGEDSGDAIDLGAGEFGGVTGFADGSPFSTFSRFAFSSGRTGAILSRASAGAGAPFYLRRSGFDNWPTTRVRGTDTQHSWWSGSTDTNMYSIGIIYDGTNMNAYGDADMGPTALTIGTSADQTENWGIFARTVTGTPGFTADGQHYVAFIWNRAIEVDEYLALEQNPYQVFHRFDNIDLVTLYAAAAAGVAPVGDVVFTLND